MFSGSVLVSFFISLAALVDESFAIKKIKSLSKALGNAFSGSIFGRVSRFFIAAEECKDTSLTYKIADRIKHFCFVPFKCAKKYSQTSVILRFAASSFFLKTENLLAIFVFLMFLVPHKMWNNMYGLIISFLLIILYITDVIRNRGFRENVKGIRFSFILFCIATVTSVIVSAYISDSIRVFMFFVTAFAFFLLVYGTVTSMERLKNISMAIYWSVFITGIAALIQNRLGIAVDPSLTDVTLNLSMPGRAFASFGNPNNYAEFLLLFIPFAIAFAVNCKQKDKKIMLICGMAVPFVALLLTYSRSGWLGFAAMIFVFVMFYNWRFFPLFILLGILSIPVLPSSIVNRIMTIGNLRDSSIAYRLYIWTGTLFMLKYFWFRGTGLGPIAFKEVYPLYAVITARTAPHSHMQLLEVLSEMGILGLLSFVYFMLDIIRRSCKNAISTTNKKLRLYLVASISSMAGIFVTGCFEYIWFYPRVLLAFFILLGVAMAAIKLSKDDNK